MKMEVFSCYVNLGKTCAQGKRTSACAWAQLSRWRRIRGDPSAVYSQLGHIERGESDKGSSLAALEFEQVERRE